MTGGDVPSPGPKCFTLVKHLMITDSTESQHDETSQNILVYPQSVRFEFYGDGVKPAPRKKNCKACHVQR